MIKLYQFHPIWNLPNTSPFCMKLETYLRMAKIPFEIVRVSDPRKCPKGKLPYIKDNETIISDSNFIINYLQQKYGDNLDNHLSQEQKATTLALRRMLEEHLYWIVVYSRWSDDTYWNITKKAFFKHLKGLRSYFLPGLIQRKLRQDLYQQGVGRHTRDEIYQLGIADLQALSTFLSTHSFCLGETPTSIDASVYAFLANIIYAPIPSPLQEYAKSQSHFIDYCERMKNKFY